MANGFNNRVLNFNQKKYNLGNLENNNNTNKHNNQATSNNVPGISVDDYNKQFENNQIDPKVQEFIDRQNLDDVEKQSIIAELTNATKSNKEKYAQEITDSEELKTRQKNEDRFLQAKIQAVTMSKTVFELEKKLNEIDKKRDEFYSKSYEEQKQALKAVEEQEEKMQKEKEFRDKINKPNVYLHSFATGMMEPLENIVDGLAMTGGYVVSGFVSIFDEESATNIKNDVSSFVNYDITDEAYALEMRKMGVSDELAYGKGHEISKMCGTMFGYVSLTVVTGGIASSYGSAAGMSTTAIQTMSSLSTGTVSAFAAAGSSGETALRNGVSFDDAAKVSFIAGGAGFVAGAALDKLGVAAKGAKTLKGVAGYSALGGVTATSEPIINSIAEYHIYGKDMVDENGEKLYQNFGDYYKNSGGLMNTIMAGGIGIGSVGAQAFSGYRANNTKNAKNISSVLDDSLSTKNSSSYVDNMATEKLINFDDSSRTVDLFATEKLVKNEKLDFGDTVDLLVTEKLIDGSEITTKLVDNEKLDFGDTVDLLTPESQIKKVDLMATEQLIKRVPLDTAIVKDFEYAMYGGVASDADLISLAKTNFTKALEDGNEDAMLIIKKLIKLKQQNPAFHMILSDDATSCFWMKETSELVMGSKKVMWDDVGTFNHEMGHGLFDMILDGQVAEEWDNVAARARVNSTYNVDLESLKNDFINYRQESINLSRQELEADLINVGSSLSEWESQLTQAYQDTLSLRKDFVQDLLQKRGFSDDIIDEVLNGNINAKDLAIRKINEKILENAEKFDRTLHGNKGAISDMLDALYEGNGADLVGNALPLTYSHGKQYYAIREYNSPFHETIANFTQIKMSGSQTALDNIRNLFGEEYYNLLESVFSKLKQ